MSRNEEQCYDFEEKLYQEVDTVHTSRTDKVRFDTFLFLLAELSLNFKDIRATSFMVIVESS